MKLFLHFIASKFDPDKAPAHPVAGEDEEAHFTELNEANFDDVAQEGHQQKCNHEYIIDDFKGGVRVLCFIKSKVTRYFVFFKQISSFGYEFKVVFL